jgi:hypothetical protein
VLGTLAVLGALGALDGTVDGSRDGVGGRDDGTVGVPEAG